MRPAERVLLAHARNGKRLTGKPRQQDVVIRYLILRHGHNVADEMLLAAVVFDVRFFSPTGSTR
jgi:hypothetical protein